MKTEHEPGTWGEKWNGRPPEPDRHRSLVYWLIIVGVGLTYPSLAKMIGGLLLLGGFIALVFRVYTARTPG